MAPQRFYRRFPLHGKFRQSQWWATFFGTRCWMSDYLGRTWEIVCRTRRAMGLMSKAVERESRLTSQKMARRRGDQPLPPLQLPLPSAPSSYYMGRHFTPDGTFDRLIDQTAYRPKRACTNTAHSHAANSRNLLHRDRDDNIARIFYRQSDCRHSAREETSRGAGSSAQASSANLGGRYRALGCRTPRPPCRNRTA